MRNESREVIGNRLNRRYKIQEVKKYYDNQVRAILGKLTLLLFCFCSLYSCSPKTIQSGKASYYHNKYQGRKTANGEIYKKRKLTAAHRTIPFGTKVTVINLDNGQRVKVRVNDRGPFVEGRIIDLSRKAAKKIDMLDAGVVNVEIRYR